MKKVIIGVAVLLILLIGVMINFSPDTFSLMIVILMAVVMAVGFVGGIVPLSLYIDGFREAQRNIARVLEVQTSSVWISVQQVDRFFRQKTLDALFAEYINKVNIQSKEGRIVSDIEEMICQETLALRSWQNVVLQVPGTFTALGLLGTFIGLITGISTIGFSSVDAALSSIDFLLSGIRTAFYTSIVGVILSIVFNMVYRILWSCTVRSLAIFLEDFHLHILPSVAEQQRSLDYQYQQQVLDELKRIPKEKDFTLAGMERDENRSATEQRLMPQIRAGLKNGEFFFVIQPRCDINTHRVVGGETLIRWNNSEMGIVPPSVFIPVVEKNGYIVQLDRYIWEKVCQNIRGWVDAGLQPVPLSVNISKTDILAMDVAQFFLEMSRKYRIPPRYLEMDIDQGCFLQNEASAQELVAALRQNGFRVTVDGFDGNFANMSFLKKMETDGLRLDLRSLNGSKDDGKSIAAVFEQGKQLQCSIMAQGIETAEQYTALRRSGCEEGQGFYLHKPMTLDEFEALFKSK